MVFCRKKKIRKAVDTEGRINPGSVSKMPQTPNIRKRGIIRTAMGTIMDRSSIRITKSFALSLYTTKPYPAREQIKREAMVRETAFLNELKIA
jgi:hypothetical protein